MIYSIPTLYVSKKKFQLWRITISLLKCSFLTNLDLKRSLPYDLYKLYKCRTYFQMYLHFNNVSNHIAMIIYPQLLKEMYFW